MKLNELQTARKIRFFAAGIRAAIADVATAETLEIIEVIERWATVQLTDPDGDYPEKEELYQLSTEADRMDVRYQETQPRPATNALFVVHMLLSAAVSTAAAPGLNGGYEESLNDAQEELDAIALCIHKVRHDAPVWGKR